MAQEVADPIRTVPQRAAANLDPKTKRVSRVKVGRFGRGRSGCVHRRAVECELSPKTATMGLRPLRQRGGLLCRRQRFCSRIMKWNSWATNNTPRIFDRHKSTFQTGSVPKQNVEAYHSALDKMDRGLSG